MEAVFELLLALLEFSAAGRKWQRRIVSVLLCFVIIGLAYGLATVLHGGLATTVVLTLGGVVVASVVADRVARIRMLPVPGLLATLGAGLIAGVLGGSVIAGHYHLASTAAELWMVGGAVLTEIVLVAIYGAALIAVSGQYSPTPASSQAWNGPAR